MVYELKHFDTPLIRFSAESGAEPDVHILWTDEDNKQLLPLDLQEISPKGIESWVKNRSIPRHRAYVSAILSSLGLSLNRPFDILRISKGLSLNDCYWVTEEGFEGSFEKYNLYNNPISRILGEIAFTGFGSSDGIINSSPELTTNGMLPKCWRRESGVIRLYKGGTSGAVNTGNEPYSEFYAAQIAEVLSINAIPYGLSKWKGILCSTCELFTSKEYSFVPVGRVIRSGGMRAVREYYLQLGPEYLKALDDMIVFDAVILNSDRHYGNFGFLVDNRTNTIAAPAPLFDHGLSLLTYAWGPDFQDKDSISRYADTLQPCVYDDFIGTAKSVLTHEHKNNLRKLLNYKLKRHRRYNLHEDRLVLVEEIIHRQAARLLS